MNKLFYSFVTDKEHHKYRHSVEWNLVVEYGASGISPIKHITDFLTKLKEKVGNIYINNIFGNDVEIDDFKNLDVVSENAVNVFSIKKNYNLNILF